MKRLRPGQDDGERSGTNLLGFIAALLLVVISLLVLLRLDYFAMRRDCYAQGMHACAAIGSGHYSHF